MVRELPSAQVDLLRPLREELHRHHAALPRVPGFRTRDVETAWREWRTQVVEVVTRGDGAVFVEGDAAPTGLAWVRLLPPEDLVRPVLEPTGRHAELCTLVVADSARGHGTGAALIARARGWARDHGAVAMHIGVRASNVDARRLYLRGGAVPAFETLVERL